MSSARRICKKAHEQNSCAKRPAAYNRTSAAGKSFYAALLRMIMFFPNL